ncbi:MAG: ABC transporter permease [Anaerolineaceae bacterium]|nr:ABC transporter permease [Anaerolineaceae bacterium]
MRQILAITKKEIKVYFSSLLALIFMASFLGVVLFVFFSVEKFFGRGIADVRPMFEWLPILLIFLLAALTMRQWSEEQSSGTLEILLTLPTSHVQLVIGKFLAVMFMILLALVCTLPLPIMVSFLGNLDWGPVFGGYLASILMASAYAAIGLFVSSRTNNQIVALILTSLISGVFYLVGSNGFTSLFSGSIIDVLRAIGTGSRFESIQRGVIDLRDLIYYLSLSALFLSLNTISIDISRWSKHQTHYKNNQIRTQALICLNLILLNVWLFPLQGLRVDLTEQKEFTISQTTKDLISNLQEPLLIRAYISEKTHPLLTPLISQVEDMLREYQIAGNNNLSTQVLDPLSDPEIEAEANQSYGIRPTPFQIAGRNESSIINAYFNILVRYGDQSVVLNLDDLIEVSQGGNSIDVKLQNLEYDLTAAIKKVVYGFQSLDAILAGLNEPAKLTLFITEQTLPENEIDIANLVIQEGQNIQEKSGGKFVFEIVNPDDPNADISRQQLIEQYGVQPFPVQLFSQETYFFHMILESEGQTQVLYPPTEANEADVRTSIETALKRTASGFLKTVGVWIPPQTPTQDAFGQSQQPLSSYNMVLEQLQKDYNLTLADLASGQVSSQIDTLLIIAPQDLGPVEQYAIDQFLMRGGAVILIASPYKLDVDQFTGFLALTPIQTGIQELLSFYGINLYNQLVLDTQNAAFPVIVTRDAGGMQINEVQAVDYPFFIDVRQNGMADDNMILANLTAVSMNWTSPIMIESAAAELLNTENLLVSSPNSWVTDTTNIQPDFVTYPEIGFQVGENPQSYPLSVSVKGMFPSYFAGQPIPEVTNNDGTTTPAANATIEKSTENARIVVFGSTALVDDFALQLSNQLSQDYYVNNLRLIQNAVDWSVEDTDLLSIRSRGAAIRVLVPMENSQQLFWEISTYIIVILLLMAIFIYWRYYQKKNQVILFDPQSNSEAQHE